MLARSRWTAVEVALWLLALGGVGVASRPVRLSGASPLGSNDAPPPVAGALADPAFVDSVAHSADRIVAKDPFRISHTPSSIVYAPGMSQSPQAYQPPPAPPKPQLLLRGIFGERGRFRAILLGVPGRPDGAIVQAGDTAGGLRVRRISRDTVIVQGLDTTWTMTVHAEWQP